MSRRQLKSDDVDGFILAAWDEQADMVRSWGLNITTSLIWNSERGKFKLEAVAWAVRSDTSYTPVARAEVLWPSHSSTSVHAMLYALLVRLERDVCRAWEEYPWETGSEYSGLAGKVRKH